MSKTDLTRAERMAVLERDGFRCVRCGRSIYGCMYSIHHRRMRSHAWSGLNKPENLITLCGSGTTGCHGWVHAHPAEAYETGYLVHAYDYPENIPLNDYTGRRKQLHLHEN